MNTFDPSNLPELRRDIDVALAAVAAKHNITFKLGSITYGANNAHAKLSMMTKSEAGDVMTPERQALLHRLNRFGLTEDDLKVEFNFGGRRFTLVGFRTRAPKKCIQIQGVDRKTYICGPEAVNALRRELGKGNLDLNEIF